MADIVFTVSSRTGNQASGRLAWADKNLDSAAISGPHGRGALPSGTYETTVLLDKEQGSSFCDREGNCWMQVLADAFGRTELGIHPDGGPAGTAGCIGITDANTRAWYDAFYADRSKKTVEVRG